eukprot:9478774-Pyramimonas_sp.AAC.1
MFVCCADLFWSSHFVGVQKLSQNRSQAALLDLGTPMGPLEQPVPRARTCLSGPPQVVERLGLASFPPPDLDTSLL